MGVFETDKWLVALGLLKHRNTLFRALQIQLTHFLHPTKPLMDLANDMIGSYTYVQNGLRSDLIL